MANESANVGAEAARAALDLSASASTSAFSASISLKIDSPILAGVTVLGVGALSLGAFYLARRWPSENAIRNSLEVRNEAGLADPEVRNIENGSITVELYCHTSAGLGSIGDSTLLSASHLVSLLGTDDERVDFPETSYVY